MRIDVQYTLIILLCIRSETRGRAYVMYFFFSSNNIPLTLLRDDCKLNKFSILICNWLNYYVERTNSKVLCGNDNLVQ